MKAVRPIFYSALPLLLIGALSPRAEATPAQTLTTYTWTGLGQDNDLYSSSNWQDELTPPADYIAPENDITDLVLMFGDSRRTYAEYYSLYASQLQFVGHRRGYYFNSVGTTTHLGSGGILYAPAENVGSIIYDSVQLHASQVWQINSGWLTIYGPIRDLLSDNETHGNYSLEKTGQGTLQLFGVYSGGWAGGLTLSEGWVSVSGDLSGTLEGALGSGTLTFNGGSLEVWPGQYSMGYEDGVLLTNNIVSNGLIRIKADTDIAIVEGDQPENFIRLDADTTLQVSGDSLSIEKEIIENEGTGPHSLTIDSYGAIIHYGNSLWSGGTQVDKGVFIFAGEGNLPGMGNIVIGADGYAGIGADNDVTEFVSKIDLANSTGTLGFDSDPESESGPDVFSDPIDLTGANSSLRIGTATQAILGDYPILNTTEQITPAGSSYRFGGGGGSLFVASFLTDGSNPRGLEVDSIDETPLTVWLLNPNNNFTGDIYVNNSALIYGPGVAPDAEVAFNLTSTGYVGIAGSGAYDDAGQNGAMVSGWLDQFAANTPGIIGFDVFHDAGTGWVINDLDTSRFSNAAIGSATYVESGGEFGAPGLTLTGTLTPNSDGSHRFVAYKGGAFIVEGTLTGDSLQIGRPDSIATFGDRMGDDYSTVMISGDNTGALSDGTTFYSGRLMIGQSNGIAGDDPTSALGIGALTIAPTLFIEENEGDAPSPQLVAAVDDLILPNNIIINSDELGISGERDFTLAGDISGSGRLYVGENYDQSLELTLSGNNTFSGGIYLANNSSLAVTSNTGTGTGPLGFGHSGGSVYFESNAPVIGGFSNENDGSYGYISLQAEGPTTLTVNQQEFGRFYGSINAEDATVIKTGAGTLRFDSGYINTNGIADGEGNNIGLDVQQGAVIFSNNSGLYDNSENQTPAVRISGGSFAVDGGTTFNNPVVVAGGGRLDGFGTYTQDVAIGDGAILSPGLAGNGMTGSIQFHHLELDAGGIYEFDIQSPDFGDYVGRDTISVFNPNSSEQTLVINADSSHPFIIRVYSVDEAGERGFLSGIDPDHGMYSWTLISFDELLIPSTSNMFDPSLFSLELDGFSADFTGDFNIALDGQHIVLQFTPVPEPSTYAMMALGLGIVAWSIHRRRRTKA
ncbi:MAG: PEP-CTERM sorting domain-containing protein [Opitutaceae bacterium]